MRGIIPTFSPRLLCGVVMGMAMVFWSIAAVAQVTSGSISGTVLDSTGAAIPNATVKLNNGANGVERTVFTNETGVFVAPNLPPGTYAITVEAPGFKKLAKTDIFLSVVVS